MAGSAYALIEVVDNDGALEKDRGIMGKLSNTNIFLDDEYVELNGYNIQDNNYFKLRDIANLFNIGLTWNEETKLIEMHSNLD